RTAREAFARPARLNPLATDGQGASWLGACRAEVGQQHAEVADVDKAVAGQVALLGRRAGQAEVGQQRAEVGDVHRAAAVDVAGAGRRLGAADVAHGKVVDGGLDDRAAA